MGPCLYVPVPPTPLPHTGAACWTCVLVWLYHDLGALPTFWADEWEMPSLIAPLQPGILDTCN